jgi:CheY-like chemotaxis protein
MDRPLHPTHYTGGRRGYVLDADEAPAGSQYAHTSRSTAAGSGTVHSTRLAATASTDAAGRAVLPRELLPRRFELFTQGDRRARAASGLGIGLAFARRLVELHGGQIEAFSAGPGQGSRFTIRLPRVAEVPAIAERVAAPDRIAVLGAAGTRVLIVDDNVDAADSLAQLLEVSGYTTKVAYDGASALEIAEILRPAIVLLDLGLPDLSGHQVAQRMRSEAWGAADHSHYGLGPGIRP